MTADADARAAGACTARRAGGVGAAPPRADRGARARLDGQPRLPPARASSAPRSSGDERHAADAVRAATTDPRAWPASRSLRRPPTPDRGRPAERPAPRPQRASATAPLIRRTQPEASRHRRPRRARRPAETPERRSGGRRPITRAPGWSTSASRSTCTTGSAALVREAEDRHPQAAAAEPDRAGDRAAWKRDRRPRMRSRS